MAQLWFKFWAKDYLGDGKVGCLSYEKRGILQTLWAYAWEEGSIPSDPCLIAELLKLSQSVVKKKHIGWIQDFFVPQPENSARLISPRLELDRMDADEKGSKARESALKRWSGRNANASADAMRTDMPQPCVQHAGQGQGKKELKIQKQVDRPASATGLAPGIPGTPPAVLVLPCLGKVKEWPLTAARLAEWRLAYPGVDVLAEAHKMLGWLNAHAKRQKTFEGMSGFALGWLGNAQHPPKDRASPQRRVVPLRPSSTPPARVASAGTATGNAPSSATTWTQREAELRSMGQAVRMSVEDLEAWVLEQKTEWAEISPVLEHHEESMC